jgi:hypothetical protein
MLVAVQVGGGGAEDRRQDRTPDQKSVDRRSEVLYACRLIRAPSVAQPVPKVAPSAACKKECGSR